MINKESKQQKSKFGKNKALMMSVYCGMLLATAIITYALTSQFYSDSISSDLSKKTVFQFNLSTQMESATIGPGDSFNVQPEIYNDATEDMYVFIKIDMPTTYSGDNLYTFDVGEDWMLVSNQGGSLVYAYAGQDMIVLNPGDVTTSLTNQMTMLPISNAVYASIDDINIVITGYAIGTEDVNVNPEDAWEQCKILANIE